MARNMRSSGKEMSMVSRDGVDVRSLTDDELIGMLEEHQAEVGPVTDTTRIVYQKKLLKLLNSVPPGRRGGTQSRYVREEIEEDDYVNVSRHGDDDDDEDVEDDVENDVDEAEERSEYRSSIPKDWKDNRYVSGDMHVRHTYRSDSPRTYQGLSAATGRDLSWRSDAAEGRTTLRTEYSRSYIDDSRYTSGDLSRSPLARPSLLSDQPQGKTKPQKSSRCPVWLQFLILLILSAVLFFVLQNMNAGWPVVGLLDFSSTDKSVKA